MTTDRLLICARINCRQHGDGQDHHTEGRLRDAQRFREHLEGGATHGTGSAGRATGR